MRRRLSAHWRSSATEPSSARVPWSGRSATSAPAPWWANTRACGAGGAGRRAAASARAASCTAASVIGADGFGFAPHAGRWEKIEQLGAVDIGDDVEIGANTCIDRGALRDTRHRTGRQARQPDSDRAQRDGRPRTPPWPRCVGIAGSTHIGAFCTFGGQVGIAGHLEIVDHVHVGAATVITRSILQPGRYGGFFPFDDNRTWEKNAATLRQLHALRARLRDLENKSTS